MTVIRNMVFKGGGVPVITYLGFLEQAYKDGILDQLERTAGTSGGAIFAFVVALGYTIDEMKAEFTTLDLRTFTDGSWFRIVNLLKAIFRQGAWEGEKCLEWFESLVERKTGNRKTTFAELHALHLKEPSRFKDLYVAVTNRSRRFPEIFSHERAKTRDLPIALAVRASMSINWFFKPVKINDEIYVDGGAQNNYPLDTFDNLKYMQKNGPDRMMLNPETLGLRVDQFDMIDVYKGLKEPPISNCEDFLSAADADFNIFISLQDSQHFSNNVDSYRTVYCDNLKISMVEFHLSPSQIAQLFEKGREAYRSYQQKRQENLIMFKSFTPFKQGLAATAPEPNPLHLNLEASPTLAPVESPLFLYQGHRANGAPTTMTFESPRHQQKAFFS